VKKYAMENNQKLVANIQNTIKREKLWNATIKNFEIKSLVKKIEVTFLSQMTIVCTEVTNKVMVSLKSSWLLPENKATVKAQNGWYTLENELIIIYNYATPY
jgi:hypothetical protein